MRLINLRKINAAAALSAVHSCGSLCGHWQRVRFGVEYPLLQRQHFITSKRQEQVLQRLSLLNARRR